MSVWLITGSSRGFGRELVGAALSHGEQVVATARRPEHVTDVFPDAGTALLALELDVTVPEQAQAAVEAAIDRFGRIDVLATGCSAPSRRSPTPRRAPCSTPTSSACSP